jgi:hypothetical protein
MTLGRANQQKQTILDRRITLAEDSSEIRLRLLLRKLRTPMNNRVSRPGPAKELIKTSVRLCALVPKTHIFFRTTSLHSSTVRLW